MSIRSFRLSRSVIAVSFMLLGLSAVIMLNREKTYAAGKKAAAPGGENNDARTIAESKAAFMKAYTVFMNPRCMNCHPDGNKPLQGDDSHIHLQNVVRGPEGKGVYAMKCKNCHQDANIGPSGTPPGNPHWMMPPAHRPMVFQGKSPRELAMHFKDTSFTGFKTMDDMIKHVDEESLVLSSFDPPAGVKRIPMSHAEFVATVKEWIAKGAAVPDK